VRIYKVKDLDPLGRHHKAVGDFEAGKKKKKQTLSKKSRDRRRRAMDELD
jgi:dolichyl-diphosphooligosaccharide--protein glycosyltransferase